MRCLCVAFALLLSLISSTASADSLSADQKTDNILDDLTLSVSYTYLGEVAANLLEGDRRRSDMLALCLGDPYYCLALSTAFMEGDLTSRSDRNPYPAQFSEYAINLYCFVFHNEAPCPALDFFKEYVVVPSDDAPRMDQDWILGRDLRFESEYKYGVYDDQKANQASKSYRVDEISDEGRSVLAKEYAAGAKMRNREYRPMLEALCEEGQEAIACYLLANAEAYNFPREDDHEGLSEGQVIKNKDDYLVVDAEKFKPRDQFDYDPEKLADLLEKACLLGHVASCDMLTRLYFAPSLLKYYPMRVSLPKGWKKDPEREAFIAKACQIAESDFAKKKCAQQ